ncbi:hypothetical protein JHK87_031859 [Glycine soja]|nr:hypothetical protein JHK87_031859 [Glycine soja]
MLHSLYKSKDDLKAYFAHPSHDSIIKGNMLPIINDLTDLITLSSFVVHVSFLKLKEDTDKDEVLGVARGIPKSSKHISDQVQELEAMDSNEELENYQKDKAFKPPFDMSQDIDFSEDPHPESAQKDHLVSEGICA